MKLWGWDPSCPHVLGAPGRRTKDSKRNFVKVDSPRKIGASSARSPSLRFNDKSPVPRGFSHQRAMAESEIKVASHFAFMCSAQEQGQRRKVLKLLIKWQWNYSFPPGLHWCNPAWKPLFDISLGFLSPWVGGHRKLVCGTSLPPLLTGVQSTSKIFCEMAENTKAWQKQHDCSTGYPIYR